MKNIFKKTVIGIGMGFSAMTISLLFWLLFVEEAETFLTKTYLLRHIFASALVGMSFNIPTVIYDQEKLPYPMKAFIHMGIGYAVFFPAAIYAKWIPMYEGVGPVIVFVIFALMVSLAIWFSFYIYYKKEAQSINKKLKKTT